MNCGAICHTVDALFVSASSEPHNFKTPEVHRFLCAASAKEEFTVGYCGSGGLSPVSSSLFQSISSSVGASLVRFVLLFLVHSAFYSVSHLHEIIWGGVPGIVFCLFVFEYFSNRLVCTAHGPRIWFVAEDDLELLTPLPLLPQWWGHGQRLPHLFFYVVLGIKPEALCMVDSLGSLPSVLCRAGSSPCNSAARASSMFRSECSQVLWVHFSP